MPGESVTDCLIMRENVLCSGMLGDDVLCTLVSDVESINDFNSKQKESIRKKCLYLRKSYEIALQYMNKLTWKKCCQLAIDELEDDGIYYAKNEKNLRMWHIQFRKG